MKAYEKEGFSDTFPSLPFKLKRPQGSFAMNNSQGQGISDSYVEIIQCEKPNFRKS